MRYQISYACATHIGNVRSVNQDNYICNGAYLQEAKAEDVPVFTGVKPASKGLLVGVFDGMGGEERGELAAYIAASNAAALYIGKDPVDDLAQFCKKTNADICAQAKQMGISSMGTTAAMLAFTPKGITLCNIGDTKVFRYGANALEQISKDHIAPSPYGTKPPLSQNLGIPDSELVIDPYFARGTYSRGDTYLICSDGLTDMVESSRIKEVLSKEVPQSACKKLVKMALANGGRDNITVIVCRIQRIPCWLLRGICRKKKEG